ncbi:MAG TPA: VCBS repeat-containing protein [Saprospiraceae bacterium]|nr:VCBS repeat-containing protein [Saprospiraceae bacterium]HMT70882.1 VCBS repeat-containing protein [Saprospiraceae bacterium]
MLIILLFYNVSCNNESSPKSNVLFSEIPSSQTSIDFINKLQYDEKFNIYTYRNFYNGGGVAIGDINNDSLPDIYFTANMGPNKLYLNKGNFTFEDITFSAGVQGEMTWSTGVTMADVNGDGYLDIYVCNSGDVNGDKKKNELFINNKNNTFSEQADKYGLADQGYSTHAVFFDYDKDGDLDMYLLNNSYQAIGSFNLKNNVRNIRDKEGGDKLFRNDGEKFIDVSDKAGIYGSVIGFGLGVTVGDINMDGWLDIYVSNDFFERDYIYMNKGDGTFKENLPTQMNSISVASMGADMADINNDCYPDIFVTEMLPGIDRRLKTKTTFEDWDKYQYNLTNDYYHQFTRNMLHLNQSGKYFKEIGRFAGVHATDWSWGAIINDFDNDGWKDLFVSNGIYQDLTDQDFLNFIGSEEAMKSIIQGNKVDYKKLIDAIPSEPISNYFFKNTDGISFENKANEFGLGKLSHSNGASYGDLDNDGDLDLVVNNVNMPASIYKNNLNSALKKDSTNYIQLKLKGNKKNTFALGSKVIAYAKNKTFYSEYIPTKGFQSSMDYIVHLGFGNINILDSMIIVWPDDNKSTIINPKLNTIHYVNQKNSIGKFDYKIFSKGNEDKLVTDITKDIKGISYKHIENQYVDFDRERLVYQMLSTSGPAVTVADFNGDKRDDIFFGGAKDQEAELYFQTGNGFFQKSKTKTFYADKGCEDVKSITFDANGDGNLDLYVASGGNEHSGESIDLKDRIYLNDGKGNFTKDVNYNATYSSNLAICAFDIENDGDEDLFVGERVKMFNYGVPCSGRILRNDNGKFKDITKDVAPELLNLGMITDAVWTDINSDKEVDLVIVGEYMPVSIFLNENGKFRNKTNEWGLSKSNGWYNIVKAEDINSDGKPDLILGNHGKNTRFKGDISHPICMHVNDFDKNGSTEQIICIFEGDKSYPVVLKHDLIKQLPFLKKKYLKYSSYQNQTIEDIFNEDQRKNMITLYAYELQSFVLINKGNIFEKHFLPKEAQFSPIFDFLIIDVNGDNIKDLVSGGNLYSVKPEIGRYDADSGLIMLGNGKGNFKALSSEESGFLCIGEVRDIVKIKVHNNEKMLVVKNNDKVSLFEIKIN